MRPLLLPVLVAALAAGLALGVLLGRTGADEAEAEPIATTAPPVPDDVSVTFDDLLRRARPDADGRVALSVTSSELTAAANNELPPEAPVDAIALDFGADDRDRPTIDFSTEMRDSGLDVTGAVVLEVRDGRVHPTLVDARAGPLPLPGSLREPVERTLDEADAFFAELASRGVAVTRLELTGERLDIAGEVPHVLSSTPPAASAGAR